MSYREFKRPEGEKLDDATWLAMVRDAKTPPPPPFTASFLDDGAPGPEQTNQIRAMSFAEEDLAKPDLSHRVKVKIRTTALSPAPAVRETNHESLLMSSDDERHVIYIENKNGKGRLVHDGVPGRDYDAVEEQWFSPDDQHVVYLARDQGKSLVVKDEVEGKRYAKIEPIFPDQAWCSFSSNCEHFAYAATLESGQQCLVVDGVEGPAYDQIVPGTFLFSGNSRHFAYAAVRRDQGWIIKDNQEVVAGDARSWDGNKHGPFLTPDGERLACMVRRGGSGSRMWTERRADLGIRSATSANPDSVPMAGISLIPQVEATTCARWWTIRKRPAGPSKEPSSSTVEPTGPMFKRTIRVPAWSSTE